MRREEQKSFLIISIMVGTLILLASIFSSNVHANTVFKNWEEIFWKKGITIQFDFYDKLCSDFQKVALTEQYKYLIEDLDAMDPDRTYEYVGTTDESSWFKWDESRAAGFGIVTLECVLQTDLAPGNIADGIPIASCRTQDPDDYTLCKDGSKRTLIDAGMRIAINIPDHRLKAVLTMEFGHAVLTLGHSRVNGSSMKGGRNGTEFSNQFLEIWSRDDRCAMMRKTPNMSELKTRIPVIDDRNWMHIPYILWLGIPWEMVWVLNGNKYEPMALKGVRPCSELDK